MSSTNKTGEWLAAACTKATEKRVNAAQYKEALIKGGRLPRFSQAYSPR